MAAGHTRAQACKITELPAKRCITAAVSSAQTSVSTAYAYDLRVR